MDVNHLYDIFQVHKQVLLDLKELQSLQVLED
jgi:hypothetical protein